MTLKEMKELGLKIKKLGEDIAEMRAHLDEVLGVKEE